MTLIIGIKCKEGVVLVSDTKITDTESGEYSYGSKILTPLENTPFVVGAAGYSDLFKEFNRKIPLVVNQRLSEFRIRNISALIESGLDRDQAIKYLQQTEKNVENAQQPTELSENITTPELASHITPIQIPHVYSYEHFMDDCKQLIKEVSSQRREEGVYPLDILIGVHKETMPPTLHYVDCSGHEHEVETYCAIGSGMPYVKQFFDRLYDFNKDMCELITLAYLAITYVQYIAKETTVGYSKEHPPEAVAVFKNGSYGLMHFNNEEKVLNALKSRMSLFEKLVKNTKLEFLQPEFEITP